MKYRTLQCLACKTSPDDIFYIFNMPVLTSGRYKKKNKLTTKSFLLRESEYKI